MLPVSARIRAARRTRNARQREERVTDQERGQAPLQQLGRRVGLLEPAEATPGELRSNARERRELEGDPPAMPPRDQVRHPLAVSGQEHDEIRVDPVAQLRRLGDELVPRGHEEPQVLTPVGEPDRGKRLLPGRHPGDRERIRRIALAGSMRPQALAIREVGRHVPDVEARRSQPTCRSRAISAAPSMPIRSTPSERAQSASAT